MKDIKNYETFIKIEPVDKGWSKDKKYYIKTVNGEELLLRIANISEYERKKYEFDLMKRISALGINMSQPFDFGTCDNGKSVYQLFLWCEGEDAERVLPELSESEQYALGKKAGEIFHKIHTMDMLPESFDWFISYGKNIDNRIESYKHCGMTFDGDNVILNYIEKNHHIIKTAPYPCVLHTVISISVILLYLLKKSCM